jgi:glycine betaine/choline ABC-type transport system substrate-binding protein
MVPFVGLRLSVTLANFVTFYNYIPHFSVLATKEYVKRTVSVQASVGAVCIGGKAVSEGIILIEICASAVPHNITHFVQCLISAGSDCI